MKTLLCYGTRLETDEWAAVLRVKLGELTSKKCDFCMTENSSRNNYCGNCGTDLRTGPSSISPLDLAELTVAKLGAPPRSLQVLAGKKEIYICQVLAEGSDMAAFEKPLKYYPWEQVSAEIAKYARNDVPSRLFALTTED